MKKLQGGDNIIYSRFYELAISLINENDCVLNLGSGCTFTFEQELARQKKVKIDSVDIIKLKSKPKYVNKYLNKSVEKNINLKKKYDVICFFELIEHVDKTDILIKNCYRNLKKDGILVFSFPNLASFYSRIELLFGYQPHILEVSNENPLFGTGIFGKINTGFKKEITSIHHIRGFTNRAMKDFVQYHGFKIVKIVGYEFRLKKLFNNIPSIAPVNIFVCKKN